MVKDIDLTVGNILGSNIVNVGLVLAVAAIIRPIPIKKGTFKRLPFILLLSSTIPLAFYLETSGIAGLGLGNPGKIVGGLLLLTFAFFVAYSMKLRIAIKIPRLNPKDLWKKILLPFQYYEHGFMMFVGVAGVILSSSYVVSSSIAISNIAGISPSVIGATIVAIGTSLPELSIALMSVRIRHFDLALGNIIGSSLTKITLILGLVLFLSPGGVSMGLFSTLLFFVILISAISWYFYTNDRMLDRTEGIILLIIYIISVISTFGIQIIML